MKDTLISRRYVEAFGDCYNIEEREGAFSGLEKLLSRICSNEDLLSFLKSPLVNYGKKKDVLSSVLHFEGLDPREVGFFCLLIRKNRLAILPSLVEEAGRLRMDLRSEIQADVESSVGFDASATAHFQNYLQKQTKKNVILRFKEDPSILSGFRAKVGNVVYDFTLDNAIKNLKLSFN